MVFSSLLFLFYFLPAVLLLYFLVPKKLKNALLLVASLVFYAWGEPVYVVIMLAVIAVDYLHGRIIQRRKDTGDLRGAKIALVSAVILNLAALGFFKYSNFLIGNLNAIPGVDIPLLKLTLPIGISFYTFQSLSYVIDVYRGDVKAQRNIISFGAYVALFPQLIAGPIVQYKTIDRQLTGRTENFDQFGDGVRRFVTGLGKKVLLANTIGLIWTQISAMNPADVPLLTAWIGILAFTFQIYFDFSGYSDMAIGLGQMFGFTFLENFNYPYMSKSITEFWRRWHISLSTWFRDYVYIPLGGNRRGQPIQIRNILIVWMLTGVWHGASWNFVAWGLFFGVLLTAEKLFLLKWLEKAPSFVSHLYTMLMVILSWALFAFDSLSAGFSYIGAMFGAHGAGLYDSRSLYLLLTNGLLLLVGAIGCTSLPKRAVARLENGRLALSRPAISTIAAGVVLLAISTLSVAYLVDASYNPFLYFRF